MKLTTFDNLAWYFVRFGGLLQAIVIEAYMKFYKPKDIEDWIDLISVYYSGWFIFGAKTPYDVPDILREKMLMIGKVMLLVIGFALVLKVAMVAGGK